MKKNNLLIGMILSSVFLFGNEHAAYEESHFSAEPIDMVQDLINARTDLNSVKAFSARTNNIANKNYQILQNITSFDASKVKYTSLTCTYENEVSKNIITSVFKQKNNIWHLQKIQNTLGQNLTIGQKKYDLYNAGYCIDDFRVNFESKYQNSQLKLIGREAVVEAIIFNKNNKTYTSTFNLSYYSLNQHTQTGWLISKIDLKPIKKRVVSNQQVPSKHRGFYLKETVSHQPNVRLVPVPNEKGLKLVTTPKTVKPTVKKTTKLMNLVCDKKEKFIRIVFTLNKHEHISSSVIKNLNSYNYIPFNLNGKEVLLKKGNCSFLSIENKDKFILNLKENITGFKYGNITDPKTSYIDFSYETKAWYNPL